MSNGGVSILLFIGISLCLCLAVLGLARGVGRGRKQRSDATAGESRCRLPFRPYLVASFAVVLQAVCVVLFAWAAVFRQQLREGELLLEPLIFIGVILVGLVYVWRKGGLSWD